MSTKLKDPKGYLDFSSGIDRNAVKAFVNNYVPDDNRIAKIFTVIIIGAVILWAVFG